MHVECVMHTPIVLAFLAKVFTREAGTANCDMNFSLKLCAQNTRTKHSPEVCIWRSCMHQDCTTVMATLARTPLHPPRAPLSFQPGEYIFQQFREHQHVLFGLTTTRSLIHLQMCVFPSNFITLFWACETAYLLSVCTLANTVAFSVGFHIRQLHEPLQRTMLNES